MTSRNLPTIRAVALDPSVLKALSLDAYDALLAEIDGETKITTAAKRAIVAHIEAAYAGDITHAYAAKGADFGSVRVSDGGYEILVDTPKKVEWDQARLQLAHSNIVQAGDDPDEYIKTALTVDERAYAAWPAHIRAVFEAARTVKPGTRTVKLVRKEAA